MSTPITGVFPVHNNIFKFGVGGLDSTEQQMLTPANLENFQPHFDNTLEQWFAMEQEGWRSALLTGKGWSISFKGKRTIGDAANDYIAGLMLKIGRKACTKSRCFPMPEYLKMRCFPRLWQRAVRMYGGPL